MPGKAKSSQFCLLCSNLYCEVVYEAEVPLQVSFGISMVQVFTKISKIKNGTIMTATTVVNALPRRQRRGSSSELRLTTPIRKQSSSTPLQPQSPLCFEGSVSLGWVMRFPAAANTGASTKAELPCPKARTPHCQENVLPPAQRCRDAGQGHVQQDQTSAGRGGEGHCMQGTEHAGHRDEHCCH